MSPFFAANNFCAHILSVQFSLFLYIFLAGNISDWIKPLRAIVTRVAQSTQSNKMKQNPEIKRKFPQYTTTFMCK